MAKIITLSDLRKREDELEANRARKATKSNLDNIRAQRWWLERGMVIAEAVSIAESTERNCTATAERIRRRA